MIQEPQASPDEDRERIVAQRKSQVWLIAIVVTVSFCVITTLVFLILWLLIK